jgi:hypothetical protein
MHMSATKSSAQRILQGICNVVNRTSVYSSAGGKLEVERLFWLGTGFDAFLVGASSTGEFTGEPPIQQEDSFFDLNHGGRWLLAETDHYVRLREQRSDDGAFLDAELKVAYPGLSSNPNARPAVDHPLTEGEIAQWRAILLASGLDLERRYAKRRVPLKSTAKFNELQVELEADRFEDDPRNGGLADHAFVSISVEAPGSDYRLAQSVLEQALTILGSHGIHLVECEGNYETFYYRKLPLPSSPAS